MRKYTYVLMAPLIDPEPPTDLEAMQQLMQNWRSYEEVLFFEFLVNKREVLRIDYDGRIMLRGEVVGQI